jgi:hypothetical protein
MSTRWIRRRRHVGATILLMAALCLLFLAALVPVEAFATTGIFEGSGHTIKLVHSEDVEMQSEDVTVAPGRGPLLFDGGTVDRVEYACKFVLHNKSKKLVTIQAGFPLNSQFMKPPSDPGKYDATELVLKYKFIVRDNDKTYHVRFVPHDKDQELSSIFLWDMSFAAGETRKVNVAYEIPMAMGAGDMTKDSAVSYARPWYQRLTMCIYEGFEYVTVTGGSWAGPIHSAKFAVETAGFEQYLADRCIVEGRGPTDKERAALQEEYRKLVVDLEGSIKNRKREVEPAASRTYLKNSVWLQLFDWHVKDRLIHRQIGPKGWREKDGQLVWEFKDYRPKEPITVSYFLTILPKTAERVPAFIESLFDDRPTRGDLRDLREIYLAWWGIQARSKAVRDFVSDQRWYSPKDGMTTDKLTAEQKAVVTAIERYPAKK